MGQKVTGGLLNEPHPIKTRGDVNRARVLPNVRAKSRPSPAAPARPAAPAGQDTDQPKSGFDYVAKRNRMMKKISARGGQRSATRRA